MALEEKTAGELTGRFPYLTARVQRARRISAAVAYEHFAEVFSYAIDTAAFTILCAITGLDEGDTLAFIYHLAKEDGTMLNLKTAVPKQDPRLATVTGRFPSAEIYEREVADLLGARIEGIPEGKRYPLPDDWPAGEYPLRKDWKANNPRTKEVHS